MSHISGIFENMFKAGSDMLGSIFNTTESRRQEHIRTNVKAMLANTSLEETISRYFMAVERANDEEDPFFMVVGNKEARFQRVKELWSHISHDALSGDRLELSKSLDLLKTLHDDLDYYHRPQQRNAAWKQAIADVRELKRKVRRRLREM